MEVVKNVLEDLFENEYIFKTDLNGITLAAGKRLFVLMAREMCML